MRTLTLIVYMSADFEVVILGFLYLNQRLENPPIFIVLPIIYHSDSTAEAHENIYDKTFFNLRIEYVANEYIVIKSYEIAL